MSPQKVNLLTQSPPSESPPLCDSLYNICNVSCSTSLGKWYGEGKEVAFAHCNASVLSRHMDMHTHTQTYTYMYIFIRKHTHTCALSCTCTCTCTLLCVILCQDITQYLVYLYLPIDLSRRSIDLSVCVLSCMMCILFLLFPVG